MKKERKDKDFIKAPYYEGGKHALEAFVIQELRYPKDALEAKIEGRVSVRYIVDYKGKVTEASIISGLGHGCDEEALRIVHLLQFRVPPDGKIKSKYAQKLHIHFRLPGSPKVLPATKQIEFTETALQLNYQVTTTPLKKEPEKTQPASYQIQINWPVTDKKP